MDLPTEIEMKKKKKQTNKHQSTPSEVTPQKIISMCTIVACNLEAVFVRINVVSKFGKVY